jgi:hypothetical protein
MDAPRRVPLLAWRRPVRFQDPINKRLHRSQRRLRAHSVQPHRRHRIGQRLPHHSPMDTQFPGDPFDGPDAMLILPPNFRE